MGTGWKIACSTLAVVLVGVSGAFFLWNGKLNTANSRASDLVTRLTAADNKVISITADLTAARGQVNNLTNDLATANGKVTSLTTDLATANGNITSLTADLATANGKVTSLTSDLANANGKVTATQASLDKASADLTAAMSTNTSLQGQLTAIQAKYPAKAFPDVATLQSWVNSNISIIQLVATYGAWPLVVAVQKRALNDGWIVNAFVDYSSTYGYGFGLEALVGMNVYLIGIGSTSVGNIVLLY